MKYSAFIDAEGLNASHLDFLAKAASDDSTRFFMNNIHIEPSDKGEGLLLGVATDGRRIHLVDPIPEPITFLGLTPGYWKVLKTSAKRVWLARLDDSITDGWNFPNWRKFVSSNEAVYETTFEGFALKKNYSNTHGLVKFMRGFPETTVVDINYLCQLGTDSTWKLEWFGNTMPLKFTAENLMAVIMPMQP